tara:strand:+ start:93981 stop:95855 length:1875 start_codon:yes stop_codon:yes gene_type:complete
MKIERLNKFFAQSEIYIFSALLIIYSLIECYLKFFNQTNTHVLETQIIKGGGVLFTLFLLLRRRSNWIFSLLLLFIFFSIGQLQTDTPYSFNSFVVFIKLIFTITVLSLYTVIKEEKHTNTYLFVTFEWILLLNSLFIIIAFFADIELAKTYAGSRFGYNGFFSSSATSSYLYIIYILSFLVYMIHKPNFSWKPGLIFLSCIFVGTKALYGTIIFVIFYLLARYIKQQKIISNKFIYFLFSAVLIFVMILFYRKYSLNNSLNEFLSKLISYRDSLFFENTIPYVKQKWNFINYLFGGIENYDLRSQMELFDVFFFFGIAGGLFYFYFFYQLFLNKSRLSIILIFVSLIFLISGNFFANSFVALAICVLKASHDRYYKVFRKSKVHMLNVVIDNLTMRETLQKVKSCISSRSHISHSVVNAGKLVSIQTDMELRKSVNSCELVNADGQAVVWASRILGKPIVERVAGIDLMENLVELAFKNKYKIFFFGAKERVVSKIVEKYENLYSNDIVAGYRNGYFNEDEEKEIVTSIVNSNAQILFVAISSPAKEIFLHRNKEPLRKVPFVMGVGGSFDVISGNLKRAPLWIQALGFEWFFRLAQEPKRMWKRYLIGNIRFVLLIFKEKFL